MTTAVGPFACRQAGFGASLRGAARECWLTADRILCGTPRHWRLLVANGTEL